MGFSAILVATLVAFLIFKSHFSWNFDYCYRTNFFGNFLIHEKLSDSWGEGGHFPYFYGVEAFFGFVLGIK